MFWLAKNGFHIGDIFMFLENLLHLDMYVLSCSISLKIVNINISVGFISTDGNAPLLQNMIRNRLSQRCY